MEGSLSREDSSGRSLRNRRASKKTQAFGYGGQQSFSANGTNTVTEEASLSTIEPAKILPLPIALLAAIAVDSSLDGLLVGIANSVGSGSVMSASISVESSFMGLTLATALKASGGGTRAVAASAIGPVCVLLGSFVGGSLTALLQEEPILLEALLGFGTSATLFMVAEELLLEAHDDGKEHIWWVDLQLYTGFFASVMATKFLE